MNDLAVIKALSYLCRIVEAGERGYAVSASNVNNQGLKILLKSHAQQRSRFKSEILAELHHLGDDGLKLRNSIRGILHRGRINIFSALSTGYGEREKIILKEIMAGEKIALKTYEDTLKKELPLKTRELISQQHDEVKKVVEQIELIKGKGGMHLIVQLFNSEKHAKTAIHELEMAGFELESVQQLSIHDSVELYSSKGATVFETSISGSVGGALWGGLIGSMAGLSNQQAATLNISAVSGDGIIIALCGILAGALIGAGLGFAIGTGISGEDTYIYDKSFKQGETLLLMQAKVLHNSEIGKIMEIVKVGVTSEELAA
jgi:uncharacterized protein (TIGR02284 family)